MASVIEESIQAYRDYLNGDDKNVFVIGNDELDGLMDGQQIKGLRKQIEVSQTDLAHLIGVNPSQIKAWESNQSVPSGSALKLLKLLATDTSIVNKLQLI